MREILKMRKILKKRDLFFLKLRKILKMRKILTMREILVSTKPVTFSHDNFIVVPSVRHTSSTLSRIQVA
jgi:hypothetical protein